MAEKNKIKEKKARSIKFRKKQTKEEELLL